MSRSAAPGPLTVLPVDPPRIAAIVLAAGQSQRMGRNKLLLRLGGVPLARRAAQHALDAGLGPVVVVVGFEGQQVRRALADLDVEIVVNHDFSGPSSKSFHAGLNALPDHVGGVVVVLPDMVHVTAEMLRAVKDAAALPANEAAPLVVSRYGDVTAPPILFRRSLFGELLEWDGEGCGKPVVKEHAAVATYVDWPTRLLDDVDTPEDWARVAG